MVDIKREYNKNNQKKVILIILLLVLLIFTFLVSLFIGQGSISFINVIKAFLNIGLEEDILIVYNVRLPRILGAILCGGGLAISGCVMQVILRNEMASPSTLGVSNASVFGVNLALFLIGVNSTSFLNLNNPYIITIFSLFFALIVIFLVLSLFKLKKFSKETIVLSGIALGTIFEALTIILQYYAADEFVATAVFFTFGSLTKLGYQDLLMISVTIFISYLFFYLNKWKFKAISNGNDFAKVSGVNVKLLTILSLFFSSLITAVIVSFVGIIGFVGLIAPQIIRRIIGDDFKFLLPSSFLLGSIVLLIADDLSRILVFGMNLPVGAITSIVGGVIFIYLILEKRGNKNET